MIISHALDAFTRVGAYPAPSTLYGAHPAVVAPGLTHTANSIVERTLSDRLLRYQAYVTEERRRSPAMFSLGCTALAIQKAHEEVGIVTVDLSCTTPCMVRTRFTKGLEHGRHRMIMAETVQI